MNWNPGRQAALNRLYEFLPAAGRSYSSGRNFDTGIFKKNHVSGLSPWIRCGLISETEVLKATLSQHSASAAEKFIMEVFWRSYFKGWLEHRPQVWVDYQYQLTGLLQGLNRNTNYQAAISAETGIRCFDAWVQELIETGFLHNHARMWFASIWIFTLKLPWQLGADFFMRHLLDGDPASNTLSWRWVAGFHTQGKTYLARADNISKYTGGRFDPVTGLASEATALREEQVYEKLPLNLMADASPGPNLLLVTEECCHAQTVVKIDNAEMVFALLGTSGNVDKSVQDFRNSAVAENSHQIAKIGGIPHRSGSFSDLLNLLSELSVKEILTVAAPVGPTQDILQLLEKRLPALDMRLIQYHRIFDHLTWPHGSAGFFKLKKKIPMILEQLGLVDSGQSSLPW